MCDVNVFIKNNYTLKVVYNINEQNVLTTA